MARLRLRATIPNLTPIVQDALMDTPEALGEAMVESLEGDTSSWPVDTGYSKDNFGFMVDGDKVILTNEAEYARYAEARSRGAERTFETAMGAILETLDKQVEEDLG